MYRAVTGPSLSSFRRMDAALEKLTLRRALLSPAQLRLCSALCIDAHAAAHPPAPTPAPGEGGGGDGGGEGAGGEGGTEAAAPSRAAEGLNASQREAWRAATDDSSPLTLIQGPPGTGKTHTCIAIVRRWLEQTAQTPSPPDPEPEPRSRSRSRSGSGAAGSVQRKRARHAYADAWDCEGPSDASDDELRGTVADGAGGEAEEEGEAEVEEPKRCCILVTGFSNVAIDNLAAGLLRLGVRVVRAGRGATQHPHIALHELMQRQPEWPRIKELERGGAAACKEARELKQEVQGRLVDGADVVIATCISSGGRDLAHGGSAGAFTHVLMDEAAQAAEPAALVPLTRGCEKLVLVGDQAQLAPQLASGAAQRLGLGESLFGRLARLGVCTCFLDTQYRMHPALAAYPSAAFYGGRLASGVSEEARPPPRGIAWPHADADGHGATPLAFLGVGDEAAQLPDLETQVGTSKANRAEARALAVVAARLLPHLPPGGLAVITPYAAQIDALRTELRRARVAPLPTVATVDSFQATACACACARHAPRGWSMGST